MIKVQQNEHGESCLLLSAEILKSLDWRKGDDIYLQEMEEETGKSLVLTNLSKTIRDIDEDPRPLPPVWKGAISMADTIEESEE